MVAVGLVAQRAVLRIAPAETFGESLQQMMICILRRVALKRAAATFEGATLAENIFCLCFLQVIMIAHSQSSSSIMAREKKFVARG